MSKYLLCNLIWLFLVACGNSSSVTVNVELAKNTSSTKNPLLEIEAAMEKSTSRGIYFEFRELNCPPKSIDDEMNSDKAPFSYPNLYGTSPSPGVNPLKDEYVIDTSSLKQTGSYQIRMIALNVDNTVQYLGFSDCPLNLYLKNRNKINICFGDPMIDRLCLNSTPFNQCPIQCFE